MNQTIETMTPNPKYLLEKTGIELPLIAFYDATDTKPFEPTIKPNKIGHACMYSFYKKWLKGVTVVLTKNNFGCGGASLHILNQPTRSHEDFIKFLTEEEGLKASKQLMDNWIKRSKAYQPENKFILY